MESIRILIANGGFATYLIFAAGICLFIVGSERLLTLYMRMSYNTKSLLGTVRAHVLGKKYMEALQACNSLESAPDIAVVKAGLLAVESGREAMKSALGGAVLEINHRAEVRLQYLSLIANVATLLGLLGTITGLIKTFAAIANADAAEKAKMLGLGISEAMNSTAAGLVIGIAAMVTHTICVAKADQIIGHAQDTGLKLITWIEQSERASVNG